MKTRGHAFGIGDARTWAAEHPGSGVDGCSDSGPKRARSVPRWEGLAVRLAGRTYDQRARFKRATVSANQGCWSTHKPHMSLCLLEPGSRSCRPRLVVKLDSGLNMNMWKRVLHGTASLGVLLLALPAVILLGEPGHEQRLETPETFATRLAEQDFQDFGFPVIVRRDESLDKCPTLNEEGGLLVSFQDVVTEFVYGARWVCVSMYTPAQPAQSGRRAMRFTTGKSTRVFGTVPGGEFLERQRLGLRFPVNSSEAPEEQDLREFAARLPKVLSLRRAGALATVVSHLESHAGRGRAADTTPVRTSTQETPVPGDSTWPLKAALLASLIMLVGVTAFLLRTRAQLRRAAKPNVEPALKAPEATSPPVARKAAPSPLDRTSRRNMAFEVNNAHDQKRVLEIDSLLNELTKHGVGVDELNRMIKVARGVHELAVKERVPCPLELVRDYLADKLKKIVKAEQGHEVK